MGSETYGSVRTQQGEVRGKWRRSASGESAAFLGIPFAQAPVGKLRFAAPAPMAPWDGVRDALQYGATPARTEFPNGSIPEPAIPGESTLNLNVFTPRPRESDAGLPVLVWIHGGGYFSGSPASPWYDGRTYNRNGVVVVSLSYRLGFDGFGWIDGAPANRGVLDWIAGLEWVQENIREFGGDPSRVTIAGQSAGGGAVMTLLGMERAQHLFSAVHSISGAFGDMPMALAKEFGAALGKKLGVEPTADALRAVPEDQIFAVQQELSTPPGMDYLKSMVQDGPLVAPVVDGELIRRPTFESYRMGIGADKALMLGATDEEFLIMVAGQSEQLAPLPLPALLDSVGLSGETRDAYIASQPTYVARGNAALLGKYLTDGIFRSTVLRVAHARAGAPTWLYRFAFVSTSIGFSFHCLDVPFWFDCLDSPEVAAHTGPNRPQPLATAMHRASVEFASAHDPGWSAWTADTGATQVFGDGAVAARASRDEFNDVECLLKTAFRP
ncbi:carboxylesterase/lipase family protein [Microbacterium sp. A196]|uniref:carboxylesterase/lipase family protein n=1 Tax=Microbacterium sp. A196 TaxID=3457320 RepID=UPI003FD4BB43